jgi:transcriptional regulator with GAF, ATPase, and Fis domain
MKIDEKDFFREATLKICGSLEIETAMWRCLLYIRNFIPVSQLNLHLYDQSLGMVETIAHTTPEGGKLLSIKTPFSSKSRKILEGLRSERIKTFNEPSDRDALKEFASKLEVIGFSPDLEFMFLDLVIEKNFIGVLSVVYEKGKKASTQDLRLLSQLNEPFSIAFSNNLRFRDVQALKDLVVDDSRYFQDELRRLSGEEVIGEDFGLRSVMDMVRQVAFLDSPVLLMGETGVGKEVIAGAIHNMSVRRDGPFIKVNCGAIPDSLMYKFVKA